MNKVSVCDYNLQIKPILIKLSRANNGETSHKYSLELLHNSHFNKLISAIAFL